MIKFLNELGSAIMKSSAVVCLTFTILGFVIAKIPIGNTPEKIIPQRPFVVISYEPYEFSLTNAAVKYKIMDGVGNVFYISEHVSYGQIPRYGLGDTINVKR